MVAVSLKNHAAALLLLPHIQRVERIDAAVLRTAMETAFGASDTAGACFFKQKTAYGILRSDWSSDVCSSD
eukprot:COSAG01_NODE_69582_length_261_cov_0.598765_1_plen_70_part_10